MRELTGWSKDLRVTADADDVVAMVGVVGLRMLADRTGLTAGLSAVLAKPGLANTPDRPAVKPVRSASIRSPTTPTKLTTSSASAVTRKSFDHPVSSRT